MHFAAFYMTFNAENDGTLEATFVKFFGIHTATDFAALYMTFTAEKDGTLKQLSVFNLS